MAPAGGSATINGILFQLLGSLARAAQLQLDAAQQDETANRVLLRIEPSGGGGDLQIHFPGKRIVEQWKAKSGGGTWSLRKVIDDVLVDLYRAVDHENLCSRDEYRFVTEGRRGLWSEAERFFAELSKAVPADVLGALNDDEKIAFLPKHALTRSKFFREILTRFAAPNNSKTKCPPLLIGSSGICSAVFASWSSSGQTS